ncbi:MAG: ABC transporter permease [Planctomycetaceae bacterium]
MSDSAHRQTAFRLLLQDYGMVLVLLLLAVVLSVLTLERQSPVGSDAGRQVADETVARYGPSARVLIVAGLTPLDHAFADAAAQELQSAGATVLGKVNGGPPDARQAIDRILQDGSSIDAIAATADAGTWTLYDRFESVGHGRCVMPESYVWPKFATLENMLNIANQTAIYAIIAIGMTLVIITGGIDLSVGSLVALASVSAAIFIRSAGGANASVSMMICGCVIGILACAAAGAFNGLMVTRFRIPPFIATLSMMMVARGAARRVTDELSIQQLPDTFLWLGKGTVAGIPNAVVLMLVLYVLAHLLMMKTVFGRCVYAVGGNAEAARLSGVPVKRVVLSVYILCGILAGLGGVVLSSKLGSGDPKLGLMLELEVIAAVVVGGTSLMGGEGRIFGTLIGAFIIAVMKNGLNLMNVGDPEQEIVVGAVVLAAVLVDTIKHRRS